MENSQSELDANIWAVVMHDSIEFENKTYAQCVMHIEKNRLPKHDATIVTQDVADRIRENRFKKNSEILSS